jgi:cell division protease FtsH
MAELEESIDRVIAGPERKSRKLSPKEKEITAYHEAGHALVAKMLPNADPVQKISIVARGMSLGHTKQLPTEDRYMFSRGQIKDRIATLLGGHAAEELIFNEITTGASHDIKQATIWARRMVTDFGMSQKLGPRTFGDKQELVFLGREISEQKDYSDDTAKLIDDEIHAIIEQAHQTACKVLTENKSKLILIAENLIAKETLEKEDLEALLSKGAAKHRRKAKVKPTPVPVEPTAEKEPAAQPGKAPAVPRLVPKQTPATPD